MALTNGFQLPFGIQPVNPVPVDSWSGPYTGGTIAEALTSANNSIPSAIRFQSMEVRVIVGGQSYKYWYRDGIADLNLVEFASTSSGISGPYVTFVNGFTGGITFAAGSGITFTQSNGIITLAATGETTVTGATGATGATGSTGPEGQGYTAIGLSGDELWVSTVVAGVRGTSYSIGYVRGRTGSTGAPGVSGGTGFRGGVDFTFEQTTTTANFNAGEVRFNDVSSNLPSVTEVYMSEETSGNVGITAWYETFNNSTSTNKGTLLFQLRDAIVSAFQFVLFNVTGNVTPNTGYYTIPVSYISGSWSSTNDERSIVASFSANANVGTTGNTGATGSTGPEGQGYTAIGLSGGELWVSTVVAGVRGTSYSIGYVRGNTGNTGNTGNDGAAGAAGERGATGNTGATGPADIRSTNSSSTFYPLFAGGSGNTAIYIDDVTSILSYVPFTGLLSARQFSASNGTNTAAVVNNAINIDTATDSVTYSTISIGHLGVNPYEISSDIKLRLTGPVIEFYGSGWGYTFPAANGTSGQALFTRGNGGLYWGTVTSGGGGGTTLFAGTGITLTTSASGTTVSTILGMTSATDGFLISGGDTKRTLGVCGGDVTIVGSGSSVVIDFPTVSTTLVGTHNTVSGISGATGDIGLVAGANVTITQAGRTFTITSSSGGGGSPAGLAGYVQYYSAAGFSADNGLVYDSSTESLRIGSTSRYITLYTSGADSLIEGNGSSTLYLQHTQPVYVGDGIQNGSGTYVLVDDTSGNITLNSTVVTINGNVTAPNIVNGISGATGNIGLLAGSNVTISQSGRTFTISSSGGGGGGGTTLFAGTGITLISSAAGITVSTILGMTSTYDGFEISGGTSSTSLLGVSGGEVRIVGSGSNVVIDFPTVSTTLVGTHNSVSGISGSTGNIGLLAGTNVTISQAGRTFTISSGSGSPSGNYVNTYDGRTGDIVTPPLLLYSLGII